MVSLSEGNKTGYTEVRAVCKTRKVCRTRRACNVCKARRVRWVRKVRKGDRRRKDGSPDNGIRRIGITLPGNIF